MRDTRWKLYENLHSTLMKRDARENDQIQNGYSDSRCASASSTQGTYEDGCLQARDDRLVFMLV